MSNSIATGFPRKTAWLAMLAVSLCAATPLYAQQDHYSLSSWLARGSNDSSNFGFSLSYMPGGIDRSGLRWEASALRGTYRYPLSEAPEGRVRGRYYDIGVGIGYAMVNPSGGLVVSIGPSLYDKDLSYVRPGERTGSRLGAKGGFLAYVTPARGPSLFSFGSYSTADRAAHVYANLGFPLPLGLSAGPEVAYFETTDYRQTRVGAHLSGVKIGGFRAGVSVGRARDMYGNKENHVGLNAYTTF
jgi:Cellulose biosynthesis protein BcsS